MKTIFISSTFCDMNAERDALAQIVLPDVSAEAAAHRESIDFIDLRWGVDTTQLESESGARKVLSVCLDEIEHAHPYMIVLLGERYGWVPDQALIERASLEKGFDVREDFKSVTALEIEFGALARGRQLDKCLFYRREGLDLSRLSEADAAIYGPESERHREKLSRLIRKIETAIGHPIPTYPVKWDESKHAVTGLDTFCEMVSADLKALFRQDWAQSEAKSEQESGILESWWFFEKKAAQCVAVDELLKEYEARIDDPGTSYFLLQGASGCGKSALMGRMAVDFRERGADVFPFACGHTVRTDSVRDLLEQLIFYLSGLLGEETPADPEENSFSDLRMRLMELMSRYGARRGDRSLYIMLDAAESLGGEGSARFDWAPDILPDCVRIVACFRSDRPVEPPLRAKNRSVSVERGSLSPAEAESILRAVFARSHKQINEQLLGSIIHRKNAGSPLYLTLLIHRLMILDSADFGEIAGLGNGMEAINAYLLKTIEETPDTTEGLCRLVVSEAGAQIDPDLADSVTGLLAVPTRGLRESDILAVLERAGQKTDALTFARLMKYLRPFFAYGQDGRIEYAHRIIRDAIYGGMEEKTRRTWSNLLWEYLRDLPASDPVCADYRAVYAWLTRHRQDLVRFVADLDAQRDRKANTESLRYLATITRSAEPAVTQFREMMEELEKYDGHRRFVRKLAGELFSFYGKGQAAQKVFRWVYEILLAKLEAYYEAAPADGKESLLKEVISCRMKLIRSYLESGQPERAGQLLESSHALLERDAGENPVYYGSRSTLHRYHAEYLRNHLQNRGDVKELLRHCEEAERLAALDTPEHLFGLINAKMLSCNALEMTNKLREAKEKAAECIGICQRFFREKPTPARKKVLADACKLYGGNCLSAAWLGKMEEQEVSEALEACERAVTLFREVLPEQRAFYTYLAAADAYSAAAEAHVFAWAVCSEEETAGHLAKAKQYLQQADDLIRITEDAASSLRTNMSRYIWLCKRYAWHEVQKDDVSALAVFEEMEVLGKELTAKTGDKRYVGILAGFGLRVPKRKKKGLFGRR
ncbi:MAG: DUF4062 domain-containing protein [Lachnospiraceae bacterium]|nr:DUF4062 domain-containing protein [Lachnospiraceae bacterium]